MAKKKKNIKKNIHVLHLFVRILKQELGLYMAGAKRQGAEDQPEEAVAEVAETAVEEPTNKLQAIKGKVAELAKNALAKVKSLLAKKEADQDQKAEDETQSEEGATE